MGKLAAFTTTKKQTLVAVSKSRLRGERSSATRFVNSYVEFAEWYLAPGHRKVKDVRAWVEYLLKRARRRHR